MSKIPIDRTRNRPNLLPISIAQPRFGVYGVGAGKFLGMRKIFARIFPYVPEKFLRDFSLQILSHIDHEDLFGVTSKQGSSCVFWFWRKEFKRWAPFLPEFSGILPGLSTKQSFWGFACTPASCTTDPSSYYA